MTLAVVKALKERQFIYIDNANKTWNKEEQKQISEFKKKYEGTILQYDFVRLNKNMLLDLKQEFTNLNNRQDKYDIIKRNYQFLEFLNFV